MSSENTAGYLPSRRCWWDRTGPTDVVCGSSAHCSYPSQWRYIAIESNRGLEALQLAVRSSVVQIAALLIIGHLRMEAQGWKTQWLVGFVYTEKRLTYDAD